VASVSVVVPPSHADNTPPIGAGAALIETVEVAMQPVFVAVKVIVAVPPEIPVTTPVEELIVATPGEPLIHVPPPSVGLLNIIVAPGQTGVAPVVAAGRLYTVTG